MDAFVFDEMENNGAGGAQGTKAKKERKGKGCLSASGRKILGDISNFQQRQNKQALQHVKQEFDSLTTKKYVENLTQENVALVKLLSDRNKTIELSRTELQNLRKQNSQLACANSQLLAEVTSSRDRLRILQHALGCQNALLKVRKVEEKEKAKRVRNQDMTSVEAGSAKCVEPGESSQAVQEHFNSNRKWQPQNLALGPPIVEAVQNNGKADNKRRTRRQSAIFETEVQETTGDSFEIKDDSKRRLRRPLASAKTEEPQAAEDLSESKNENRRILRRQSARFKTEEPEVTEETKVTDDLAEISDDHFLVTPSHDDVVHENDLRLSLVMKNEDGGRSEEQESQRSSIRPLTDDLAEISDDHFLVTPSHDDVVHENDLRLSLVMKNEDGGRSEEQESQRSSIRPLRRAAEKVKSYKEIAINVKMRRDENYTMVIGSSER